MLAFIIANTEALELKNLISYRKKTTCLTNSKRKKSIDQICIDLLKIRTVQIREEINDEIAKQVIACFLYLQSENAYEPIKLDIHSGGGAVTSSLAILDTMKEITCPVHTHCSGIAAGTALSILVQGEKGHRTCVSHANLRFTRISTRDVQVSREIITEVNRLKNILVAEFKENTNLSHVELKSAFAAEKQISIEEAHEFGIVDFIS